MLVFSARSDINNTEYGSPETHHLAVICTVREGDGAGVGGVPEYVEGGEQVRQGFAQRAAIKHNAAGGCGLRVVQAEEGVRLHVTATAFEQVAGDGGGVFDDFAAAFIKGTGAGDGKRGVFFRGLRQAQDGNCPPGLVQAVDVLPAVRWGAVEGDGGNGGDGVVGYEPFAPVSADANGGERDAPVHPR